MSTIFKYANQDVALNQVGRDWLSIGHSTVKTDTDRAERAIAGLYRCAGLNAPRKIFWFDSPLTAALFVMGLRLMQHKDETELKQWLNTEIQNVLYTNLQEVLGAEASAQLNSVLLEQIGKQTSASIANAVSWTGSDMLKECMRTQFENQVADFVDGGLPKNGAILARAYRLVAEDILYQLANQLGSRRSHVVLKGLQRFFEVLIDNRKSLPTLPSLPAQFGQLTIARTLISWQIEANLHQIVPPTISGQVQYVSRDLNASIMNRLYSRLPVIQLMVSKGVLLGDEPVLDGETLETAVRPLFAFVEEVGWIMPFHEMCVASRKPETVRTDERGRLHCESEPAVRYADGWGVYAWHGVLVPKAFIEEPESIKIRDIDSERNLEVRRVMIERYGVGKYLNETGGYIISQDSYGVLYGKMEARERVVFVKLTNCTAEPDGTFKEYFLRVPPNVTSAREAVAWTFGMSARDYRPAKET